MSGSGGSGGQRQTGTVPKTKHNTRHSRRDHNQIPNHLDWNHSFQGPFHSRSFFNPPRGRKESNTSRLSDGGDDYDENPWIGLPIQNSEDGARSWAMKSSNLSPERSASLSSMDTTMTPQQPHHHHHHQDVAGPSTSHHSGMEDSLSSSRDAEKKRLRMKIEMSQRKIDELQQQQAAFLSMRNKAVQQVKPVQTEEMHPNHGLAPLRNKAVQQVKPVQPGDFDQINNIERRIQNIQEFTNLMQSIESDIDSGVDGGSSETEQQLRRKLQDLIDKKAHMDNLLAYFESTKVAMERERSAASSDDGDGGAASLPRECCKRDNRSISPNTRMDDLSLKLDRWVSNIENGNTAQSRSAYRVNGDGAASSAHGVENSKALRLRQSDKAVHKKTSSEQFQRKKSGRPSHSANGLSQSNIECWSVPTQRGTPLNSGHISSDEADYDESPVKLCPPNAYSSAYSFAAFNKPNFANGLEIPMSGSPCFADKCSSSHVGQASKMVENSRSQCDGSSGSMSSRRRRQEQDPASMIGLQLSQLQMQLEQIQSVYQTQASQKRLPFQPPDLWTDHPPPPPPPPPMNQYPGYVPYSQWHQNQLLISSLNQCCQLIWHQLREIAGLRQALSVVRGEEGGPPSEAYGPNLDPSMWQPPLNNQVAPGNRANNYWDNFRSYSRQNLLSGRTKSNELRRSPDHPDNLRRIENNSTTNNRSGPLRNGGNLGTAQSRRNMNKIKLIFGNDPISLEQNVYSELEHVISEPNRSPRLLIQLVNRLKAFRFHESDTNITETARFDERMAERNRLTSQDGEADRQDCLSADDSLNGTDNSSRNDPPEQHGLIGTAAAISRIAAAAKAGQQAMAAVVAATGARIRITPSGLLEATIDSPPSSCQHLSASELSARINSTPFPSRDVDHHPAPIILRNDVDCLEEVSHLLEHALTSGSESVTEDLISKLAHLGAPRGCHGELYEALLNKFLSANLSEVADEILCFMASGDEPSRVEEMSEEEGAVGGCATVVSPHNVETELVEADQRSSCENLQALNETENAVNNENENQENQNLVEDCANQP